MENQIGKVYGRLTILAEAESSESSERATRHRRNRRFLVRCCCEAATEKVVLLESLRSKRTTSCGCAQKDAVSQKSKTHGLSRHPLYSTWLLMIHRCENPKTENYASYGGRGIQVSESWKMLENFVNDMYPTYKFGLTLDRKDNNLGYSKENCRWATPTEQGRNKRNNRNITVNGTTKCVTAWCEELGLKVSTVLMRLKSGKTPEQALQI